MNYGFPNWMFAAIAIAAYEIADWLHSSLHVPYALKISYAIILICLMIIGIRKGKSWVIKKRRPENPDSDDWQSY